MSTARDRLHLAFSDTGYATSHLRQAARHLDSALAEGGFDTETTDKLIMLADQITATSTMTLGFATAVADIDGALRAAGQPTGEGGCAHG